MWAAVTGNQGLTLCSASESSATDWGSLADKLISKGFPKVQHWNPQPQTLSLHARCGYRGLQQSFINQGINIHCGASLTRSPFSPLVAKLNGSYPPPVCSPVKVLEGNQKCHAVLSRLCHPISPSPNEPLFHDANLWPIPFFYKQIV